MAKDVKRSIRNKYNIRLRNLHHILEQYLIHAEDRLNKSLAGNVRNREETEAIVEKSKELLELLPKPKEVEIDFDAIFNSESNIDEILKQGQEFIDNLTEEEWEEIRTYEKIPNKCNKNVRFHSL